MEAAAREREALFYLTWDKNNHDTTVPIRVEGGFLHEAIRQGFTIKHVVCLMNKNIFNIGLGWKFPEDEILEEDEEDEDDIETGWIFAGWRLMWLKCPACRSRVMSRPNRETGNYRFKCTNQKCDFTDGISTSTEEW